MQCYLNGHKREKGIKLLKRTKHLASWASDYFQLNWQAISQMTKKWGGDLMFQDFKIGKYYIVNRSVSK